MASAPDLLSVGVRRRPPQTLRAVEPAQPEHTAVQARSGHRYATRALGVDLTMLGLTMAGVALVSPTSSPTGQVPATPLMWLFAVSAAIVAVFAFRGMYARPMRLELIEVLRLVVAGSAVAVTATMAARVFISNDAYVAAETVRHWLIALPFLAAGRSALLWHEARARRQGEASRRTLIVGGGRVGKLTAERLLNEPELGLRPVAFLDDDPLDAESSPGSLPILSDRGDFESLAGQLKIEHVIIAFSRASHDELLQLARTCWELGITVSVVPRLFEIQGQGAYTEHLGGLPLVAVSASNPRGWQFALKYALDRVVAAFALLVIAPIMLVLAGAVALSMGRPILYRQRRVGRDGQAFDMLKFRTMRETASGESDADWAEEQLGGAVAIEHVPMESRVTRIGSFLRRASLDELPQLWNVVRGEMSLIGPRPERATYVERFEKGLYRYGDRHRVKSGLTGWAQVNGLRGKTSLRDRTEWDNHYIDNWSLWLDFKIALMTVGRVVRPQSEVR